MTTPQWICCLIGSLFHWWFMRERMNRLWRHFVIPSIHREWTPILAIDRTEYRRVHGTYPHRHTGAFRRSSMMRMIEGNFLNSRWGYILVLTDQIGCPRGASRGLDRVLKETFVLHVIFRKSALLNCGGLGLWARYVYHKQFTSLLDTLMILYSMYSLSVRWWPLSLWFWMR